MTGQSIAEYGDRIADVYDAWPNQPRDLDHSCDVIAALAAGGRVLELGIGTGRVALPLRTRGVDMHGIEASEAMLARLRAKPGGAGIPVVVGDFADVAVDGRFAAVIAVFSTLLLLTTQEDQVRCFANVAAHLADGGVFVVEAEVPNLERLRAGQAVYTLHVDADVTLAVFARYDRLRQLATCQQLLYRNDGVETYPLVYRYAWPAELDLMARLAGLRLRSRWANWDGAAFTADSRRHVSIYERDGS